MKKRNILMILLSFILLIPLNLFAASFSDISGHWAQDVIVWASENNYISGYPDGTFRPQGFITRAEYYAITNQFTPEDLEDNKNTSNDTQTLANQDKNKWYYSHLKRGMKKGFVSLDKKGNILNPDEYITREEAFRVTAINEGWQKNSAALDRFKDKDQIRLDYREYVGAAVSKNMVAGYPDKTLKPKNNLTRGEVVSLISRMKGYTENSSKKGMSWTWGFENSSGNFGKSYLMNNKEIKIAKNMFNPVDFRNVYDSQFENPWEGSCQGFAVTSALFDYGKITASGINTPEVKDLISARPQANYNSQSLINLHMLIQNTNVFKDFESKIDSYGQVGKRQGKYSTLREYANELKNDLDKARNGGSKVVVGMFFNEGGHAMTAYDYTMSGNNMLVKVYDSNGLCKGIDINLQNNKIIGKKLTTNANSQPMDTEIFYIDSFPIEDYAKLLNNKFMNNKTKITLNKNDRLNINIDGTNYVLDNNYSAGNIYPSRDAKWISYELPSGAEIKITNSGSKIDFFINSGDSRYVITSDKGSIVTIRENSIGVQGQKGKYKLQMTKDSKDGFNYDTLAIEGRDSETIKLNKYGSVFTIDGKYLNSVRVIGSNYDNSVEKSFTSNTGFIAVGCDGNGLIVSDRVALKPDQNKPIKPSPSKPQVEQTYQLKDINLLENGRYAYQFKMQNPAKPNENLEVSAIYYFKKLDNHNYRVLTGRWIGHRLIVIYKTTATYNTSNGELTINGAPAFSVNGDTQKREWPLESHTFRVDGKDLYYGNTKLNYYEE